MSVVINATIMYAQLAEKNEMSDKYQVDLCEISPAGVRKLEEMGITVNNNPEKPEKGDFITCRSQRPIFAYDTEGEAVEPTIIGNGSQCAAAVSSFDWKFKNKSGTSPSLQRLVITSLEVYDQSGGADVDMSAAI